MLTALFGPSFYLPHGTCYAWMPEILWLHVSSDLLIAFSYFSIPTGILFFLRKKQLPFPEIFKLFSTFIFLCGLTHLASVIVIWLPFYELTGLLKALTALISIVTVVAGFRLLPAAIKMKSPTETERLNKNLQRAYRDIEQKVHARTKELAGLVTEYKTTVDTAIDGLVVISAQGIIQKVNKAALQMFGYTREELVGANVNILMPSPYHEDHDQYLRNYLESEKPKIIGVGREVSGRRKDGSEFPIALGVNEMEIEGSKSFVGTIQDISDRKASEDRQQNLLDQLTRSNTELERFAYVASHDMQEPVRMITSFSSIISNDYAEVLDEDGKKHLNILTNAGHRLHNIIDDLLAYSRINSEEVQFTRFNGQVSINGALENLQELILQTDAHIELGEIPTLYGNPVQIMRLFQNLITNGIKYQSQGQRPIIKILSEESVDFWHISIIDNGRGIQSDYHEEIFEPFRRLQTWDQIQGSGLGLSICQKIVQTHGGSIYVESAPSSGSVFTFTLAKPKLNFAQSGRST